MTNTLKCSLHNLPEEIICIGQFCPKRIGCQLCVQKHEHKFYLDTKCKEKKLHSVQTEILQKINHLKNYTITNVKSLKLENYKQKISKTFEEERLFLKNKIEEEKMNFQILMDKTLRTISDCLSKFEEQIKQNWSVYYKKAEHFLESDKEFSKLEEYFKEGDWTGHEHVENSINFLYSEELLFRFNRNLDNLKKQINHHKYENDGVLNWLFEKRHDFKKYELCPHQTFQSLIQRYQHQPTISPYINDHTKQTRDDSEDISSMINHEKALMMYPKIIYQPFQNIHKLIRYSNNVFATSGGRSVNIWTRVSMQPEKSYGVDFPTYGLSTFREVGQEDPEILIFGKSNGELGLINIEKETVREMSAHEGAIKDIIQIDEHHFLTASLDWLLKVWALNSDPNQKNFASERLSIKGHSGKVHVVCKFGPSVLAAGSDNQIRLWDIMRSSYDETFVHEKQIYALCEIRPQFFASGGELKQLRVWDYRKTKTPMIKLPIQHSIQSILKYNANTIIFNDKNIVKVVDIRNFKEPLLRFENNSTYSYTINTMEYLSDVEIGMGGSDNFVTLWKY